MARRLARAGVDADGAAVRVAEQFVGATRSDGLEPGRSASRVVSTATDVCDGHSGGS
ncbi:hypothetical protein D3C76_1361660 [compost metagenome]